MLALHLLLQRQKMGLSSVKIETSETSIKLNSHLSEFQIHQLHFKDVMSKTTEFVMVNFFLQNAIRVSDILTLN